jgi:hypothetical protein
MRFGVFSPCEALRGAKKSSRAGNNRAVRAASAGLTILQRAGAFCIDPEQPPAIFMISKPQRGLLSTAVRVR